MPQPQVALAGVEHPRLRDLVREALVARDLLAHLGEHLVRGLGAADARDEIRRPAGGWRSADGDSGHWRTIPRRAAERRRSGSCACTTTRLRAAATVVHRTCANEQGGDTRCARPCSPSRSRRSRCWRRPPPPRWRRDPILFVHGWAENESVWTTMISNFSREGWTRAELNNWRYNTSQSNVRTASEVSTKVEEILRSTGAARVDLIAHSMGSLNTRYYLKNLSGTAKVDDWVSLGGPNHGTTHRELLLLEALRRDAHRLDIPDEAQRKRRDARHDQLRHVLVELRRNHQPGRIACC